MNPESSMVSYYAERAAEYEHIYHKPERQDDLRWLRDFVGRTFADTDVFELACGTGYWTEILARSAASVVATDINEEVLAIARSKPVDPAKTTFRKENAYDLPIFPQRFTGGLAVFWWSHVPKARLHDFLRGFHRALSPAARVVFIDNCYVAGSSTPVSRTDEQGDTYQLRRLDGGSTHEVLKNFLEPFRGRGYALQACRAIAPFVRSFYDAVTITCDLDNHASRRIIERLGASFTDEVPVPPHDAHFQRGSRSKRRYRWTL